MKQVFISHVREDKPLLTPYLDMLLDLDPGNIKIWVDRPRDIPEGVSFMHDSEFVHGIEIGKEWNDQIESALNQVDVVLTFWSKNAKTKDSQVYIEEIFYSRKVGKLVPVTLDPIEDCPFMYGAVQVADLSRDSTGRFKDALASVHQIFIHGPKILQEDPSIDPHNLPYLVNRDKSIGQINRQITRDQRIGHYVVPCAQGDVFDKFAWRLAEVDGPQLWSSDGADTLESWSLVLTPIETHYPLDEQAEELSLSMSTTEYNRAFEENIQKNRPFLIYGQVLGRDIVGHEAGWIKAWVEAVEQRIHESELKLADGVEIKTPICSILAIIEAEGVDADISNAVVQVNKGIPKPRSLSLIRPLHFQSWLDHEEIKVAARTGNISLGQLGQEMEDAFDDLGESHSMKDFETLLRATPTWNKLLQNYLNS